MARTDAPTRPATILNRRFDPTRLPPGVYLTTSRTSAYGPVRAMVIGGLAKLLGFKRLSGNETALTVRVGKPSSVRPNPTIGIGPEFFQGALKDYRDWKEKWWREAVQNSVDAGAKNIDLRAEEQSDGTWLVSCEDDGGGMNEDTLLNKFLVLGGSTKKDETGAAGGFGKAKELLVLPWLDWSVHTRDKRAQGKGIGYEVIDVPYLKGTRITVRMAADQYTYDAPAKSFLSKCNLPHVKFRVNGEAFKTGMKGSKLVESIPEKFDIYFAPSDSKSFHIFVRANGIYMFDRYLDNGVEGVITVELTGRSIDLLTANRDSFRDYSSGRELDRFTNKLAADTTSALRDKRGLIKKVYEGTGTFRAKRREVEVTAVLGPIPDTNRHGNLELRGDDVERVLGAIEDFHRDEQERETRPMGTSLPNREIASILLNEKLNGAEHVQAVLKQLVWEPDFLLVNEEEGFKVPTKFKPESMTPTVLRLAKVWTEMCRLVMTQLGCDRDFGVGFVFSKGAAAMYMRHEERDWLMVNPLKDYRRLTGLLDVKDDLRWLYAAAIHEATHMADGISYHNEDFAAALTHNMAKCADGYRTAKKVAGAVKMKGSAKSDG